MIFREIGKDFKILRDDVIVEANCVHIGWPHIPCFSLIKAFQCGFYINDHFIHIHVNSNEEYSNSGHS